ncbi:hypothetical protein GCM10027589_15580 [Actinocorallia lasiicapitis]
MKRMLAALVLGVLAFWSAPALAADPPPAPVPRPGKATVVDGHVDVLSATYGADKKLAIKSLLGTGAAATEKDPAELVFRVKTEHVITQAEAAAGWDFLGPKDTKIWGTPAALTTGDVQLGWSFAKLVPTAFEQAKGVTVKLASVTGPGRLEIFKVGPDSKLQRLLSSDPAVDRTKFGSYVEPFAATAGATGHQDLNWAFTKDGVYEATFEVSVTEKGATAELKSAPVKVAFVVGGPTTSALTATPVTDPSVGDKVTLVATVTPPTAEGHAAFYDGETLLGSAPLVNGAATFETTALTAATHSLTARYAPKYTDDFAASTSPVLSYLVKPAGTGSPTPTTTATATATATAGPSSTVSPCTTVVDGHLDYVATVSGGKLESKVKDASGVYKEPGSVAVRVTPTATVAAGQTFLGTVGSTVWALPGTQTTGAPYLGWANESTAGEVTWTVDRVTGPGKFVLYTAGTGTGTGTGASTVVLSGKSTAAKLAAGAHAHGTWAFTQEGVYRVTFVQKATLTGGVTVSDTDSLIFMVGNAGNTPVCDPGSGNLAFTGSGPLMLFASIGTMLFSAGAVFLFFTRRKLGLF